MQVILSVTALTASILSTLAISLAYRAAYIRKIESMGPGTDGGIKFTVANRAHANLLENMPIFIILLAIAELGVSRNDFIAVVAFCFTVARISHAVGYTRASGGASILRTLGNMVTWLCILLLCFHNVVLVFA